MTTDTVTHDQQPVLNLTLSQLLGDRDLVALVVRQPLRPVAGHGTAVFPASYAAEKSGEPGRYCISPVGTGNLCVIDSVQSQAGRIEAQLQTPPYRALTRTVAVRIVTKEGERVVDVLAAAHRIYDAVFRFSTLADEITRATQAHVRGDARALAELSPLSLVCGAWDSRGTKHQIARAFSSEIVALDVSELSRGAQYTASVRASEIEGMDASGSVDGLDHVPSFGRGGVIARAIERRSVLSLTTLRRNARMAAAGEPDAVTAYLGALALVVLTMPVAPDLRSGCMVLPDGVAAVRVQRMDGTEADLVLTHAQALAWATEAAAALGVPTLPAQLADFEPARAKGGEAADGKPAKGGAKIKPKGKADAAATPESAA